MRGLAAALVIILTVAFQTAVMPDVVILGIRPDFVIVLLATWVLVRGQQEGRLVVFVAAILYGMLSADPPGFALLALAPIIPLAALLTNRAAGSRVLTALALVACATLLYELLHTLLLAISLGGADLVGVALRVYPLAVIANIVVTPPVYAAMVRSSRDLRFAR